MNLHPTYTRRRCPQSGLQAYRFRTDEGRSVRIFAATYSDAIAAYRRAQLRAVP